MPWTEDVGTLPGLIIGGPAICCCAAPAVGIGGALGIGGGVGIVGLVGTAGGIIGGILCGLSAGLLGLWTPCSVPPPVGPALYERAPNLLGVEVTVLTPPSLFLPSC